METPPASRPIITYARKRPVSDHTVNGQGTAKQKSSERIKRIRSRPSSGTEIDTSKIKNEESDELDAFQEKLKKRHGEHVVFIHYQQRYRRFWETDDKFKDWISAVKNNSRRAYCSYCECEIQARRSALMQHRKTLKHINSSPFKCSSPVEQDQTLSTPETGALHLAQNQTPSKCDQSTTATASVSSTPTSSKPVKLEDLTVAAGSGGLNNSAQQGVEKDDEYDIFGKSVAMQLRRIHPTLRDDVMFNMNSQLYNALKAEIVYDFPTE